MQYDQGDTLMLERLAIDMRYIDTFRDTSDPVYIYIYRITEA